MAVLKNKQKIKARTGPEQQGCKTSILLKRALRQRVQGRWSAAAKGPQGPGAWPWARESGLIDIGLACRIRFEGRWPALGL